MAFVIQTPQYRDMLKNLAMEQDWEYVPGLFMKIAGRDDNGDEWSLEHSTVEECNYVWRSAVPLYGKRAWIRQRAGPLAILLFSGMRRYCIGPQLFQGMYVTAATSEAVLCQLLSPEALNILMGWPRALLMGRNIEISLKSGLLRIDTRVSYGAEDILKIVRLGMEMKKAALKMTG